MDTISAFLIGIVATVGGWFSNEPQPTPKVGAFGDPFLSLQVGTSPQNGYYLQTDGTNSSWQPVVGGGGSGGGTFSTTTCGSVFCNFPNNVTDVVVIGSTATSSGEVFFDPNAQSYRIGSSNTASTTLMGNVYFPTKSQGFAYLGSNSQLNSLASSSILLQDLGGAVTDAQVPNTITVDLAGTATALAANGANCSAGSFPLGVDASGAVETCAAVSISGITNGNNLADLTATNASLTFSGAYNGGTARTVGLNVGNANTWTVNQTFNYSSTTGQASFANASSTEWVGGGLQACNATTGKLNWDATTKQFKCDTDQNTGGSGGADFTYATDIGFGVTGSATTTKTKFTLGIHASSTSQFDNATSTLLTAVTGWFTNIFVGADTLAEYISDTAGAFFTGNTETGITVTYQDADNTVDVVCNTADTSTFGCLTDTDWDTFNNKAGLAANTFTGLQTFPYSSSTIYSSFLHASTTNFTFGGVTGNDWTDFCTSITGSADLCDGSDASGAGGSSAYEIATTSDIAVSQVAYISKTGGRTTLASVATSSVTINAPLTSAGTAGYVIGGSGWTLDVDDIGAADLASADFGSFTCNGTTCSVDAGAISNTMLANSTISGVALGSNLNALTNDTTLNGSSYNGSSAISDWGLNLANANTWTAKQDFFGSASSTLFSSNWLKVGGTASTTIDGAGNVALPTAGTLTIPALTSALTLTGAGGELAEYAGTSCTNQFVRSLSALGVATCATVGSADVSLANLTATDATLTFSGTYNGGTARTIGLNLGNANTWTAKQNFFDAASSTLFSSNWLKVGGTASTTIGLNGLITTDGGVLSNASSTFLGDFVHNIGYFMFGTSTNTRIANATIASSTAPQLSLSAGAGLAQWTMRNAGGNLYFSTTTVVGTATTSVAALELKSSGLGLGIATSTFSSSILGLGTSGSTNGTSTIAAGKIQIDGYNTAGTRVCMYVVGTTLTIGSGACNQ